MIATLLLGALISAPREFAGLPLGAALQKAAAISPDVAQARARVTENEALLAAARGIAAPALTANYALAPQGGNAGNTTAQRLTTLGGQIVLGDYWAYAPQVREAYYTLQSAQFDLLDAQRAERIKVIGQYYDALKAVATVDLRQQDRQGAGSDLRAAQLRYRAGDAPRLDVVRAQVALANAQATLAAARVDLANARDALAVETGQTQAALANLTAAPSQSITPLTPQAAVARATARRADLFSAQQSVQAEEAAVRVAERGVLPAVTLSAGYTRGVDSGVLVHGPSANVNVSLPISHTSRDRALAERARLAQAQFKEDAIRRQITVQVSAAARTYDESVQALRSATAARVAAQQELRATEIGYRNGASSSLDIADARRTYLQAALTELSALYAKAQAAATLQEQIGP